MKYVLALGLILLAAQASGAPMRDMSLSPSDTMRQPTITHSSPQDYFNQNRSDNFDHFPQGQSGSNYGSGYGSRVGSGLPGDGNNYDNSMQSKRFMDNYCDPNFHAGVGNSRIQDCMAQGREKACDMFSRLPPDAQHIIDQSISCVYAISETGGDDALPTTAAADPSCAADEHRRMVLIKKYWTEQETAYAMVFLPDMVLNASTGCMRGGY